MVMLNPTGQSERRFLPTVICSFWFSYCHFISYSVADGFEIRPLDGERLVKVVNIFFFFCWCTWQKHDPREACDGGRVLFPRHDLLDIQVH